MSLLDKIFAKWKLISVGWIGICVFASVKDYYNYSEQLKILNPNEDNKVEFYNQEDEIFREAIEDNNPHLFRGNYGIVIVDMQKKFLDEIITHERERLISNQKSLLEIAAENDIPVLIFEYSNWGKTLPEIQEEVNNIPRHKYFEKDDNDGFESYKKIDKNSPQIWLKNNKVKNLIITGVNTDVCVYATVHGAYKLKFKILTSIDLVATDNCDVYYCPLVAPAFNFFLDKGRLFGDYEDLETELKNVRYK